MTDAPDDDHRPWLQIGDFPPTKSASLHVQRRQYLRIKRGERADKTSQYLGVSRSSLPPYRWRSTITNQDAGLNGVGLGSYATEELAARAYDLISRASYGPEGTTNFPKDDYKGMGSKWARAVVAAFASGQLEELKDARKALARAVQIVVNDADKQRAAEVEV